MDRRAEKCVPEGRMYDMRGNVLGEEECKQYNVTKGVRDGAYHQVKIGGTAKVKVTDGVIG